MALDWNKEISFSGLFKGKGKSASGDSNYPTKTSMHLYVVERNTQANRVIPVAIVLVVLVALFVKFGVVDQYARLAAKQAELAASQSKVTQLEAQLADYDEISAEYKSYVATGEAGAVDTVSVLNLVTDKVMPYANVSGVSLGDGVLTLTLSNASLETVGSLATQLSGEDMVENVSVSTASNNASSAQGDVATVTIKLAGSSSSSSNGS